MPSISPRMSTVLSLFFSGANPYDIYSGVYEDATIEEHQAFDAEVMALEKWFGAQGKQDER